MKLDKKGLRFLSLGGAEEVGYNLYVYAVDGRLIVVDLGYGFLNDEYPGMDMGMADSSFLNEYKDKIEAIFITHAHEDHFGAIGHFYEGLNCPVYATKFTMGHIKNRLKDKRVQYNENNLKIVENNQEIDVAGFNVKYISMVHSTPQNCALFIKTKYGNIFHATDWKFDNEAYPEIASTNMDALNQASLDGVDVLVGDSTNVFSKKLVLTESQIRENLIEIVSQKHKTLVATCFASNIIRLKSLLIAAHKGGRTPVIAGMSIINNAKIATECGYFNDIPKYLEAKDAKDIPLEKILYICAGSQGNYKSGLYNIVHEENKNISLGKGDCIIFTSQIIPGNEQKIEAFQEKLRLREVEVISKEDYDVHVGGHGGKEEIEFLYKLLKPKIVVPVHGDKRALREHKRIAEGLGVKEVITVRNGEIMAYNGKNLILEDQVTTDIVGIDRKMLTPLNSDLIRNRRRVMYNCNLFISAVFSQNWNLEDLQVSSIDIMEENAFNEIISVQKEQIFKNINKKVEDLKYKEHAIADYIKVHIRKEIFNKTGIKPVVFMHLYKKEV